MSVFVRKANKATSKQLAENLPQEPYELKGQKFCFSVKKSNELSPDERDAIWKIADTNMRVMSSQSSMGWDEVEKKAELFHPNLSRFIIATPCPDDAAAGCDTSSIAAFTMFRFEYEYKERLLYCYEMQVVERWRRYGLGRFLMHELVGLAKTWKMHKVMLTVLKANASASQFYASLGFVKDPSCPDYVPEGGSADEEDVEECDYDILSLGI